MGIHLHFTTTLAVIGALSVGGASLARAQDTSSATRSDTMGYQPSQGQTDTAQGQAGQTADTTLQRSDTGMQRGDSGTFRSNGAPSDTALRAKPGVQTGPSASDSGKAMRHRMGAAGRPDTVVCKDGSNAARRMGCGSHGGIDWAATRAAMKARGHQTGGPAEDSTGMRSDSTQGMSDTTQVNKQGHDYQYHGAPSDTALRAKPGTQTGETADSGAAQADSASNR
jgi:hypothetical protein